MRALIHIERLRRLADHLASGKFAQDYSEATVIMCMNILYFNEGRKYTIPPWFVGELGYLFPEHFKRNALGYIIPIFSPKTSAEFVLPWFFGVNSLEYGHLFVPNKQRADLYSSEVLTALAKPEQ